MKGKNDLDQPATKRDMEEMGAHIVGAIVKALENYPTKGDLKDETNKLAHRIDSVEKKLDEVALDVSDIKRRVIDLEVDAVRRPEFEELKKQVHAS